MLRYYFHLHHGAKRMPDPDGLCFLDRAAALAEALRTVREMLAEDLRQGKVELGWRMEVVEEGGVLVHVLDFGDVLGQGTPPYRPPLRQ